ncbi:MAG: SRPBCC family protein [Gemmatimonadales bacterium]
MPIDVSSNPHDLTLTVVADYPVPVERLWDAYADPRQLERFWGPEHWPATFTRHDMAVGGRSHYYMTGPDGTVSHGWFRFLAIEPGVRIELEDGFGDAEGNANPAMPTMRMVFHFESTPTGSRFRSVTTFPSIEAMERLVKMGMMEGMKSAMGQIDAVLADLAAFAASRSTEAQLLSDTQVRISRIVRGTVAQVWRAHHEPELIRRWLLGPDGWTMPVCVVAARVGEGYRYEWEKDDGSERFGFEGELLESAPPHRAVTSERMIGMPAPWTRNELTLTQLREGTLLSLLISYPSTRC